VIQPLFEHRQTFGGYQTRVLELEGDGVPIILFHGYADSADTWRHTLAVLARQGHPAIAVDLPGFAEADPLTPDPILPQLDGFAADALRYLGGRPRRPVLVVGNSLGGCLSLRVAERHADRLAGVVAVAPAGLVMSRLLSLIERDPVLRSIVALPAPLPSFVLRAAVARIYGPVAFASPERVDRGVITAFTSHIRARATAASYLQIAHRLVAELHQPFELERITSPLLVVWGDRDRLVFHRGAERILEAVPGARLELLEGVGHCPQVEVPDRFAKLLTEFSGELDLVQAVG
jgi:pimeloyl-ACP methyl ester carboxylesterase